MRAFDLPCLEQAGFEADDLIATYARQACEAGATATIVSSDKDLMQLVNDCVVMYDTMKDKKIGRAEVIEKFGVPPEKVIEVQALIGDSTDNVPGVPGIGVKTAAQLTFTALAGIAEADTDIAAGLAKDRRVDSDHFAAQIDQRTAGIAGIDRRVGLNEVVVRSRADISSFGADDA